MPNNDHEEAIKIIRDYLSQEFNLPVEDIQTNNFPFRGTRPDIFFHHPRENGWVVVEVGSTKAETVCKYLQNKNICEVRWYTRLRKDGIRIVARWKTNETPLETIDRTSCKISKLKRQIERDLDNLNRGLHSQGLSMQSFLCCTGCGRPTKIEDLKAVIYHGREYGVCSLCKSSDKFHTAGFLEEAIALYDRSNA